MSVPSVLIVDDEAGLLGLFASLVERLGYQALQANGGQAALDILADTVPDLMILDLAMPEISGIDVLTAVQANPALNSMCIIVLTALGFTADLEVFAPRVSMWLHRPIMPTDFMSAVHNVVEDSL